MKKSVVIKKYNQNQLSFLPSSYYGLVPKNHPDLYVDESKIESNVNRFTFIFNKKFIKNSKERIKKQLKELWNYVGKVYKYEVQTLYVKR